MTVLGSHRDELDLSLPLDFEKDSRLVLSDLRSALADLFTAVRGGVRRPVDVQKAFGVDRRTSWRLFKVASSSDPLGAGIHVPGRASIERALSASDRHAIPAPTVRAVLAAVDRFERLVDAYAGDRTTFDSMISVYGDEDAEQIDVSHRRAAFRANGHILGVQSRAQMVTQIYFPNRDDPDLMDCAIVQGSYELRRLRTQVSWPLAVTNASHDRGVAIGRSADSLEPSGDDRTGLIADFSDHPRSQLRVRERDDGRLAVDLVGDAIGLPSSSTCLFGHTLRGVAPWYRTDEDEHLTPGVNVVTPTELLVVSVLLHERTFGSPGPTTEIVAGDRRPGADPQRHPPVRLPIRDRAEFVGSGAGALHVADLPRYSDLLARSLERLGQRTQDFSVYRLRIEYPVTPSTVLINFPLPARS